MPNSLARDDEYDTLVGRLSCAFLCRHRMANIAWLCVSSAKMAMLRSAIASANNCANF